MAEDVLSQSEIDKLLSALSDGSVSAEEVKAEEEERKVKVYDFKRPDRFSKDQIRTLFMLHESFSRLLNTYLSATLRTMVEIEVLSVEQLTYQEFVQSMANPSVIGILALPPLKGNIIVEVNTDVAFAYIDRVFGGEGKSGLKSRALTDIETAVMRRFIDTVTNYFKEAWSNVVEFRPNFETMETNPQFAQIVPPSDMVVLVTIHIKMGEVDGMMNICIPYLVLEPVMSKLTTSFWVASSVDKESSPEQVAELQRKIERTRVPFTVELGTVDITIHEFLTLGFGDVLQLDTLAKDELVCYVGSNAKFRAHPGTSGKRMAVQISGIIEGDDDANE
ncbi:flagellar motor switch protein FliM [Selenomonas sp. oral taxon 126]|uniref:flagellar motor switch protein FliM n=1 Tax=Selenomonas sp. oral taxon 126 TaxID=712528 RepID=UPI0008078C36|nr:flagellar motor switch protein FliM [Selenomonas sp. oral taxon 126]ANR70769.1 flagellar motor switch protein FliM [Selenomonas sp. oral taxon 126]